MFTKYSTTGLLQSVKKEELLYCVESYIRMRFSIYLANSQVGLSLKFGLTQDQHQLARVFLNFFMGTKQ